MRAKLSNFFSNQTWVFVLALMVFSLVIRLWHLGTIKDQIFDEVYFVNFAKNYLNHVSFFDIHPPLGKLIIAIGIKFFGDVPFGWRIMPAIFGTLLVGLIYLVGKELKNKFVGFLAALVIALDGMFLVYSRVGLMDIMMVFFILLAFYLFLKFTNKQKIIFMIFAGISLGLAASIKYIAGLVFFTFVLTAFVKKIPFRKYFPFYILFLFIIPILIYLAFFLFNFPANNQFFSKVLEWHNQSLNYNLTLKESHPYGSKWWTWFLLLRPIWLYFKDVGGRFIGVDGLGNPLAWWSSVIVIPLLIWRSVKGDKTSTILLGSFLIFLIPWAFFKRVLFYYHAIPSFIFLSLGIGLSLEGLRKDKLGQIFMVSFIIILIFLFIYFLPIWIGLPIDSASFYHRMWLKGWI